MKAVCEENQAARKFMLLSEINSDFKKIFDC